MEFDSWCVSKKWQTNQGQSGHVHTDLMMFVVVTNVCCFPAWSHFPGTKSQAKSVTEWIESSQMRCKSLYIYRRNWSIGFQKIASSPTLTSEFSRLRESGLRSTFTHPEGKENRGNSSTSDLKISTLGQIVCKTKLWISWRATWQLTTIINNNNYKEFPSVFPCFQQLQT